MAWIKQVLLDIAITVMIVLAVAFGQVWARWVVLIYTPFMLIMKIVVVLGSASLSHLKRKSDGVPPWFYHVLYGVNVAVLVGYAVAATDVPAQHGWLLAGGWALIWILSIAADLRMRPAAAR